MLSPSASSPTSPEPYKRSPSEDRILSSRATSREMVSKPRSSSESSDREESSRKSRLDFRPGNITSYTSKYGNAPGGLLWKRRQGDETLDSLNQDRVGSNEKERAGSSVFDNSMPYSGYKSRYGKQDDTLADRSHAASNDVFTRRSRSGSRESDGRSSSSDGSDKTSSQARSDGVILRRKPEQSSRVPSGKRLSKEEIEAALNRADTYLSHRNEMSDFQAKRRSWELREQNAETTDSNLFGWSKYKNSRLSRSTDALDDRKNVSETKSAVKTDDLVNGNDKGVTNLQQRVTSSVSEPDISGKFVSAKVVNNNSSSIQNEDVSISHKVTNSQSSKPPIPSKPPISSKPKVQTQSEASIPTNIRKPTRPAPVPRRTAPPPPPKHSPPPLPQQSSPLVQQSDVESTSSEVSEDIVMGTTPAHSEFSELISSLSEPSDSVTGLNSEVSSSALPSQSVPIENVISSESAASVEIANTAVKPQSVIQSETLDDDYEPVLVKHSMPNVQFQSQLPPPPPYPKPPPPPYQSVVTSSSYQNRSVHDEPPSPAPQPGAVENKVVAHHYENVSSSSYVQRRQKHPGEDPNDSVVDGYMEPPSPVRRMVNSMTQEESHQILRKG
ncbi:hypothetical protein FSP39_003579 [Pinctada imbricata]|uniref:Uncharacterized protein n=1 Tax=Pinctada imbricata TaxID=66713 RepID=A0AA89BHL9_PINIB|nr:hypothetical protein FSP39_003579 [Pinctada imbricata]